jgi:uncharacterized membrane protein YqjE
MAALQTRLELLSVEAEEQLVRVARLCLLAAGAVLLLALALVTATVFVILLFWDIHRIAAAGVLALVYLGAALALAALARREAKAHPRPFRASLAELAKDRRQLKSEA